MDVDLKACIGGDKRAWDQFVHCCSGVIIAAVQRTMQSRGGARSLDIEDPVQEVFVKLVRNDFRLLRTYDPDRAALSTWLTIVARSVTIDHLRKRRLNTVPLEDQTPASAPAPRASPAGEPPPLHVLTDRQRLVLRMLFDEDMSVAEAAGLIGVDEQTIRSTKHKALSRLREHMPPR
jgi:DNA-directed RNA polymerase specialized sigma24 family protein